MSCKRTGRRPPPRAKLAVDSLAFGGDAVARDDEGRVVFVPGGAPGDRVEVEILEEKKGYARAKLLRVLEPGPTRRDAPCRYFDECGGCQWQHVTDAAQAAAKEDIVRRALRKLTSTVLPILTPAPPVGWRRRARFRFRGPRLGLLARRSHELVDLAECLQLEPALGAALAEIRVHLLPELGASGEICMLAGDGVHVVIQGANPPSAATLVGRSGIAGVLCRTRDGDTRHGAAEVALDEGSEAAGDQFAQASRAGNQALREVVRRETAVTAGQRVLELYAGSGNFTRDLVAAGARVVAVEGAPGAAIPGAETRREPVENVLPTLAGQPFDLVLLDPPRSGAGPDVMRQLDAPRVVYVSCDPPTLARDLEALASTHRVLAVQPIDLMPQTFHVEVVVTLARLT
jgi:23S rRNA (uracil1939-C5)-methyltransferase